MTTESTLALPAHFRNVVARAKEVKRAEVLCGFETANGSADLTMTNLLEAAEEIERLRDENAKLVAYVQKETAKVARLVTELDEAKKPR